MKKLYTAIVVCAMLMTTGCAASEELSIQTVKPANHVTSSAPEVTVEQILNEYNSSRKTVEIQSEENDPHAPLAVAGCACQMGDSYILFPKVEDLRKSEAMVDFTDMIAKAIADTETLVVSQNGAVPRQG